MLTVDIEHPLKYFTLQVEFQLKNEIAGLYGPSGAGKTTILNSIAGLMKLHQGNIRLNHRDLTKEGKTVVPVQDRRIGYVFQDYALFPHRTIWGNIKYGMKEDTTAKRLIEELGITHLLQRYPHEISGGEKQRVALIRALATEPELLLLDEPFSALDEKTKEHSYEQLLNLHEKWQIPVLLVTHNKTEISQLANKIIHVEAGKIV